MVNIHGQGQSRNFNECENGEVVVPSFYIHTGRYRTSKTLNAFTFFNNDEEQSCISVYQFVAALAVQLAILVWRSFY